MGRAVLDRGAVQLIEQDIAVQGVVGIGLAGAVFQEEVARKTQPGGAGSRLAGMVGLGGALREDDVGALFHGLG